jgi:hypothetical protein
MSTQRMRITRWPPYIRDRHATRSRTTAGVLDAVAMEQDAAPPAGTVLDDSLGKVRET